MLQPLPLPTIPYPQDTAGLAAAVPQQPKLPLQLPSPQVLPQEEVGVGTPLWRGRLPGAQGESEATGLGMLDEAWAKPEGDQTQSWWADGEADSHVPSLHALHARVHFSTSCPSSGSHPATATTHLPLSQEEVLAPQRSSDGPPPPPHLTGGLQLRKRSSCPCCPQPCLC